MSGSHDFRPDAVLRRTRVLARRLAVLGDATFQCGKINTVRPITRRSCGMRWSEFNPDRRKAGKVAIGQGHVGSSCTRCTIGEAHAAGRLPDGTETGGMAE